MQRRKPLVRRTPLSHGEEGLKRTPLARVTGLKAKPMRRTRSVEEATAAQAFYTAVCTMRKFPSGTTVMVPCLLCPERSEDAHHVYPQREIKKVARTLRMDAEERSAVLWSPANGVPLCRRCHDAHETAFRRIPRAALPQRAWDFASELDRRCGLAVATSYIERTYP